jgi:catechol 2,3-dioxygenase-like lactoylglutathione lyase family enzyme
MPERGAAADTVATASAVRGFSHVQLVVSDLQASEPWYATVLGMERFVHNVDDAGKGYLALRHACGMVVGMQSGDGALGVLGVDHLAFAVASKAELESWGEHLTAAGIEHGGVEVGAGGRGWSIILWDPDHMQVELAAP